ncbi:MAG: cadherin-like domain-containing protein, partial [Alphaproteobacteria bacterium]|nr:cadherin-like domain-containing protein [Alphaproteobacteria bacterium]
MPPGGNKGGGGNAGSNGNGGNGGKGGYNAIRGGNGADILTGTAADDWVDGKGGDDWLFGWGGNDLIEGDQGNDTLVGGFGDDHLDGGQDIDTAAYLLDSVTAPSSSAQDHYSVFGYSFSIGAGTATISDIDSSDDDTGIDTLVDVEYAVFSDDDADGDGTTDLVTVYLDGTNNAVLAKADIGAGDEDTDIVYDAYYLIANDIEFDGDSMHIVAVGDEVNGSVTMVGDTITFTPDTDYSGFASFTYTVDDGLGGTDTQIVRIDIAGVADKPIVTVGDVSGDEDTPIALSVFASPADIDGSEELVSLTVSGIPVGAKISDGSIEFTATAGNTQVDILSWDNSALTFTPPANSDGVFMLTVTAEAKETVSNGDTETTAETIAVTV